jgi:enoyl-CoA hydratase/carnithine racemase
MAAIEYARDGHVGRVTINRPERLNAMTVAMDEDLAAVWAEIDADPAVRVAVLTGAGERAFCVGADIGDLDGRGAERVGFGGGLTGLGGPLVTLATPLVAAVRGHALGGGCELALCADLIVAAGDARFGLPETRIGIIGDAGVLHRAVRQLPQRVAMAMILAGEPLDAERALHFGLVNEVVPPDRLAAAADAWADRVAAMSPLANRAAKEAVMSRRDHPLDVALATRFTGIERYQASDDRREAARAFAERRPPAWSGR